MQDNTIPNMPNLMLPPEPDIEAEEEEERAVWVGSPEASKADDGISDLFEVDTDTDTDDLVSVDMETDIIDGPLDDLTDVTDDDVMGDELGQVPLEQGGKLRYRLPRRRIERRYNNDGGMAGMR